MTCDPATVRAFLEPHHLELTDELNRFCPSQSDLDLLHHDEAARRQARVWLERLGQTELITFGVEQPDMRAVCLIREALAATSPLADSVYALQCLGSMPLTIAGSPQQKERWLKGVAEGSVMTAFAMTEPQAGSDVVSMTTSATLDGNDYVLNGEKCYITNAGLADLYTVFARTDPGAGHRGISCFLVEATNPGLKFLGPQVLAAPHPLGRIGFRDCRVGKNALVGDLGRGFHIGMATLDYMRPTVGAAACGMAHRALQETQSHTLQRHQFGQPLADFQLVAHQTASMAIELAAARLLVFRAAWEKDQGAERITTEAAQAKAFACEAAQRIVDTAVQLHGGAGVLRDSVVDHLYRSVRALRIYEGATEVQHLVVAREMRKRVEPVAL